MTRSRIYQHVPHALLLAGAAVGLSLTINAPQDAHAPREFAQTDSAAEQDLEHDRPYMDAQGNTRSLADILRQARARMNAIKKSQDEAEEDQLNPQTPLAPLMGQEHRRMVKRRDIAPLPVARHQSPVLSIEYVETVNPLIWEAPQALEARTYTVLGFGEVGQEQTEASSSDINSVVPASQPTDPAGVFVADAGISGPFLSAGQPTVDTPVTTQPSASTVASATPVVTMQSASMPAPTPVPAQAAMTTTPSDSDRIAVQDPDRPNTVNAPGQSVFTYPSLPANDTPAADRNNLAVEPDNRLSEKTLANTNPSVDKKPPTVTHSIGPAQKTDAHPVFPIAPKEVASVNTPQDGYDEQPSQAPAKSTGKANNPLLVYIDGHEKIGSDRVNAIDSALSRINQAVKKADLDVELKITTDQRSDYNIQFAENDGRAMGKVLGLAEFAVTEDAHGNEFFLGENSSARGGKAKVSINNAFNWFAGDDANDIADDEFDYQTAVEHEFLHLLGLDDDFDDQAAVSHGLLNPGTIRRDIDDHEIDDLADLYANANPWQSSLNPAAWSNSFSNLGKTRYKAKALTAVVPEPATLGLIGLGLLGIAQYRKR